MATDSSLHSQLIALRPQLLRFAHHRMGDRCLAEDAVQDSLLAVLETPERYSGKSLLSTYVIGILKFKIIDYFREGKRFQVLQDEPPIEQDENHSKEDDVTHRQTTRYGIEQSSLLQVVSPLDAMEQQSFFGSLENALSQISQRSARAFILTECFENDRDEVCKELAISKNNLMVQVHRVRQALKNPLFCKAIRQRVCCIRISFFR